jgi:hypothetical protein
LIIISSKAIIPNKGTSTAGIKPVIPLGIASVNHRIIHRANIASPYFAGASIEDTVIKRNIKKLMNNETTFFRIKYYLVFLNYNYRLNDKSNHQCWESFESRR